MTSAASILAPDNAIRRQLCLALVGLPASLLVHSQAADKKARVGFVYWSGPASPGAPLTSAELAKRGWVEGRNLELVVRSAEGREETIPGIIDELLRLRVDVIVANGNGVALGAKSRTRTVPIVAYQVWEPVEAGLVSSITRPGGNVTGRLGGSGFELMGKLLALLKEAAPSVSRMAYLSDEGGLAVDRLDPAGISRELIPNTFGKAARKLGITLTRWEVNTPQQLERAFAPLKRQEVNGLYVDTGRHLVRITELARLHRLPACYGHGTSAVPIGGLMGYVSVGDPAGVAAFVDKVLRGANPGDLPMEEPQVYELWLNLKAAKAIGLLIPATVQVQTARVFE